MKTVLMSLFCCSLFLVGTNVFAKTPDGETPAVEDVCSLLTGAAFGLCNAYCEAMDCHLEDPKASSTACGKVGDKLVAITGEDPPCEEEVCAPLGVECTDTSDCCPGDEVNPPLCITGTCQIF